MTEYKVGDKVLFYIDVVHENPVEGEIVEIGGLYIIQHKGLKCGVQERFIVSKIIPDKELIMQLEERILNDNGKIQDLIKRLAVSEKEIERLKENISKKQIEIDELKREQRSPFDGYNWKKRKRSIEPLDVPPMIPKWRCDVDDHERYRQKYACGFLEY